MKLGCDNYNLRIRSFHFYARNHSDLCLLSYRIPTCQMSLGMGKTSCSYFGIIYKREMVLYRLQIRSRCSVHIDDRRCPGDLSRFTPSILVFSIHKTDSRTRKTFYVWSTALSRHNGHFIFIADITEYHRRVVEISILTHYVH